MAIRVLVAHGNTQRLKDAVTALHGAGFEVTATPDGGDAFARFFEDEPDLVICSEQLPGLSGSSIARMVRSQSKKTPVVLLIDGEKPQDPVFEGVAVLRDPLKLDLLQEAVPEINFSVPEQIVHEEDVDLTSTSPVKVFVHAVLKRFQRVNPVLAVLNDAGISRMAAMAQHRACAAKESIIKQGDDGDGFYLVVEGQVRVLLAEKDNKEVARINAGGFFGEMAMLSQQKRSASIEAVGATTLLWFEKTLFLPILADYPQVREVLSGVALKRSEENLWRVLFDDDEVQRSLAQLDPDAPPAEAVAEVEVEVEVDGAKAAPVAVAAATPLAATATTAPATALKARRPLLLGFAGGAVSGLVAGLLLAPLVMSPAPAPVAARPSAPVKPTAVVAPAVVAPAVVAPASSAVSASGPSAAGPVAASAPAPSAPSAPAPIVKPSAPVPAPSAPAASGPAVELTIADAFKANNYKQVLQLAAKADPATIDEMSAFAIAESQRHSGIGDKALASYLAFRERYPTSSKADDAAFWAADLYSQGGMKDEAQKWYQKVADDPASNFRNSALKRLTPK